ncbi:Hypothetical protein PHPALM_112 [Phytophthora palmivora]|uniref:Uncharacterized protein n=1 Tax=Phytophthora palmivora TaxID=4796 RepID=A0A2P4YVL5_9STRA|nr:Hypothetical protein PHPALM_112 [Phytophthora palmivora]
MLTTYAPYTRKKCAEGQLQRIQKNWAGIRSTPDGPKRTSRTLQCRIRAFIMLVGVTFALVTNRWSINSVHANAQRGSQVYT